MGWCLRMVRTKRLVAFYLAAMVLLTGLFFVFTLPQTAESATFTARLTAPASNNKYFYDADYNIFYAAGYGMPNCTAYAYGRAYEILGSRPNLCPYNAGEWWSYNIKNKFYSYGQTPRLGAIACWDNYDSDTGHVAVVEQISGKNVTFSESAYGSANFFTQTVSTDDSHMGYSNYRFLGYIYIGEFSNSSNEPNIPSSSPSPSQKINTEIWRASSIDGLNLRSSAGTSSTRLLTIPNNAVLKITEKKSAEGYTWGKTTYNGKTGWCALDYAKKAGLLGDVDQNGKIQVNDAILLQKYIGKTVKLSTTQKLLADTTGAGKYSTQDVIQIQKFLGGYLLNL